MKDPLGVELTHYSLISRRNIGIAVGIVLLAVALLLPLALMGGDEGRIGWILILFFTLGGLFNMPRLLEPWSIAVHEDGLKIHSLIRRPTIIRWDEVAGLTGHLYTFDLPASESAAPPERHTALLPPYRLDLTNGSSVRVRGEVKLIPLGLVITDRTMSHLIEETFNRMKTGDWIVVNPSIQFSLHGLRMRRDLPGKAPELPIEVSWRELNTIEPEPGGIRVRAKGYPDLLLLSPSAVSNYAVFIAVVGLIKEQFAAQPRLFSPN